ncbi:MAG: glutamyl-tRNA reductase [Lachnospiraceae bacterium]|nr:glutamyl-tRNA reductase [Lachnospiraceae bacterium]
MNQIKMIGIDHSKAAVEYRELFSFTRAGACRAMEELKEKKGIDGVIILSTCNRMELWVSADEELQLSLYDELCGLKGVESQEYAVFFTEREGDEAVRHLFETACGLKSKIIGDDQIITQVKNALSLSREVFCTDKVLETLFRTAVSAGKKVKTQVRLTGNDTSAITGAVHNLKAQGFDLGEMTCMVIGNGEMGKLAATALIQEGADVTVTVRQYHNGQVQIPRSCSRINYGDRLEYLKYCDLVVSATASPNCTIKYCEITQFPRKKNVIMIDLAVPRDIDKEVGMLEGVTLYDIDSFGLEIEHEQLKEATREAEEILQEFIADFNIWYGCRDLVPVVQQVCTQAAQDVELRLTKPLRRLNASVQEKEELEKAIETATSKVVNKILFGLRDNLCISTWRDCMEAVSRIYEES